MSERSLLLSLRVLLLVLAVATLGIGVYMAQPWGDNYAYQDASGYLSLAAMLLWAVSPLAGLAVAARWFRSPRWTLAVFAVGAAAIGVLGVLAYIDVAFVHPDAQGGLAFLTIPVVQWLAALCLFAVCTLLRFVGTRRRSWQ